VGRYDAPWPPAKTTRDARWAALLGGQSALARAGWGRRIRAYQAAPPEVQDSFGFDDYWSAVIKRIGRLDSIDPRWLDELDRYGASLKQLRWLAGPGDGYLPEKIQRMRILLCYLRDRARGLDPGRWVDVAAKVVKVGVGARPTQRKRSIK
jgi:hypothetical protein